MMLFLSVPLPIGIIETSTGLFALVLEGKAESIPILVLSIISKKEGVLYFSRILQTIGCELKLNNSVRRSLIDVIYFLIMEENRCVILPLFIVPFRMTARRYGILSDCSERATSEKAEWDVGKRRRKRKRRGSLLQSLPPSVSFSMYYAGPLRRNPGNDFLCIRQITHEEVVSCSGV